MDFNLSDEQRLLVESAQAFVKKTSPIQRARRLRDDELGFERRVWKEMAELGWVGILLPESAGGLGGRFIDAALLLEQLGTALVPEPFVPSVVLGGMAIALGGTSSQHERWLGPLGAGDTTLALAATERGSRYGLDAPATVAEPAGGGWLLRGEKIFVLNGHAADAVVVSARTRSGVSLFVVERGTPGLAVQPLRTMDGRRAAVLRFDGAKVAQEHLLGAEGAGLAVLERVVDAGAAAAVAEGVGIMQRVLEMTCDYLRTREQFGVKIASFQVLQHRAVDMFVELDITRSMALLAALSADDTDAAARRTAVSAAKVQLTTGGELVTQQGIQLHGGIGVTDEHDVGLYFKRMAVLNALFGDDEHHVKRFAAQPSFSAGI